MTKRSTITEHTEPTCEHQCRCEKTTHPAPTVLLTLSDVARELRVSLRQAWRMLSSGRLYPADLTLGGLRGRRWRRDRFEAWVAAGCPCASAWASHIGSGAQP